MWLCLPGETVSQMTSMCIVNSLSELSKDPKAGSLIEEVRIFLQNKTVFKARKLNMQSLMYYVKNIMYIYYLLKYILYIAITICYIILYHYIILWDSGLKASFYFERKYRKLFQFVEKRVVFFYRRLVTGGAKEVWFLIGDCRLNLNSYSCHAGGR